MRELIEEKVREYIEEHGEDKAWDVLNLIKLDQDQFDWALQLLRNGEGTISEEQMITQAVLLPPKNNHAFHPLPLRFPPYPVLSARRTRR